MRIFRIFLAFLMLYIFMTEAEADLTKAPSGRVVFHEDWRRYSDASGTAVKVGTGPTKGIWKDDFTDNTAWVLALSDTEKAENGFGKAKSSPDGCWDAPGIVCVSDKSPASCLWLPFGRHGMNRVRHDFAQPYPETGVVDVLIWVKSRINMRQRGISLILGTPSGGTAVVSIGMWIGTRCPSYRIQGMGPKTFGYDDNLYHPLPEIVLPSAGSVAACGGIWDELVIDIGKSKRDEVTFRYRRHDDAQSSWGQMAKPLKLMLGKDYTCIKSVLVGSLPLSQYAGENGLFDNAVFVGDIWLTQ